MSAHATFYRGKRVFVQLRDGGSFVDRWAADTHRRGNPRVAAFEQRGKIPLRDIRAISIYRGGDG